MLQLELELACSLRWRRPDYRVTAVRQSQVWQCLALPGHDRLGQAATGFLPEEDMPVMLGQHTVHYGKYQVFDA